MRVAKNVSGHQICLLLVTLISIYIISCAELNVVPGIQVDWSLDAIKKTNLVLCSLSYSIIAAYIFYIFANVMPRIIQINRSKIILSQDTFNLLYELFVLINQILHVFKINATIETIEEKDVIHINGSTPSGVTGVYSTSEHWNSIFKGRKQFTGLGNMQFSFPDGFSMQVDSIIKIIQKIRSKNPLFYCDEEYAGVLSSIETNSLFEWYANNKQPPFRFEGSSTAFLKLILDYRKLESMRYQRKMRNSYHKIHFYNDEEIANIPKRWNEFEQQMAPQRIAWNTLNPSIIYSENSMDARAICSVINKAGNIPLQVYTPDRTLDIKSKCIIFITDGIVNKEIRKFISLHSKDKILIIVKKRVFKCKKLDKLANSTKFGIHEIRYRSTLTIFGIKLFKTYPTASEIGLVRYNIHEIISKFKPST